MDNNIFNGIANKFWTDGYIHIKSVFNKNEMKSLKKELLRFSDSKIQKNKDLMLESKINKYLLDNRIVNIVKKILGDNPVYFGDISYTIYKNIMALDNIIRIELTVSIQMHLIGKENIH